MTRCNFIVKRIYSTTIGLNQQFYSIPRCIDCLHFCPQSQICKKFSCKSIIARTSPFKCGLFGLYFVPK